MRTGILIVLGLLVAAFLSHGSFAVSDACIDSVNSQGSAAPSMVSVVSTVSWLKSPPTGSNCAQPENGFFHSDATDCNPLADEESGLVAGGAYCSAKVDEGGFLRCMWALDVHTVDTAVYVGWDRNNDGRIKTVGEVVETVLGPLSPVPDPNAESPTPQYVFANPTSGRIRAIAFPTNIESEGPANLDKTLIGCAVL